MKTLDPKEFEHIVFFTGAGMSVESGIPTYRGEGGTWHQYRYQEYACQEAFEKDPKKVWEFHHERRRFIADCEPHEGHLLIARLQQAHPKVTVITQNIDGMHQRAGCVDVIELHGSLWRVSHPQTGEVKEALELELGPQIDGRLYWRPDIVWFGDMLRDKEIARATEALCDCDLMISIGTSAVVFPAAQMPELAKQNQALLYEINPERTALSHLYEEHIRQPASSALSTLFPTV